MKRIQTKQALISLLVFALVLSGSPAPMFWGQSSALAQVVQQPEESQDSLSPDELLARLTEPDERETELTGFAEESLNALQNIAEPIQDILNRACCSGAPGIMSEPPTMTEINSVQNALALAGEKVNELLARSLEEVSQDKQVTLIGEKQLAMTAFFQLVIQLLSARIYTGDEVAEIDMSPYTLRFSKPAFAELGEYSQLGELTGLVDQDILDRSDNQKETHSGLWSIKEQELHYDILFNRSALAGLETQIRTARDSDEAFLEMIRFPLVNFLFDSLKDTHALLRPGSPGDLQYLKKIVPSSNFKHYKLLEESWTTAINNRVELDLKSSLFEAFMEAIYKDGIQSLLIRRNVFSTLENNAEATVEEAIASEIKQPWSDFRQSNDSYVNDIVNEQAALGLNKISAQHLKRKEFEYLAAAIKSQLDNWYQYINCEEMNNVCYEERTPDLVSEMKYLFSRAKADTHYAVIYENYLQDEFESQAELIFGEWGLTSIIEFDNTLQARLEHDDATQEFTELVEDAIQLMQSSRSKEIENFVNFIAEISQDVSDTSKLFDDRESIHVAALNAAVQLQEDLTELSDEAKTWIGFVTRTQNSYSYARVTYNTIMKALARSINPNYSAFQTGLEVRLQESSLYWIAENPEPLKTVDQSGSINESQSKEDDNTLLAVTNGMIRMSETARRNVFQELIKYGKAMGFLRPLSELEIESEKEDLIQRGLSFGTQDEERIANLRIAARTLMDRVQNRLVRLEDLGEGRSFVNSLKERLHRKEPTVMQVLESLGKSKVGWLQRLKSPLTRNLSRYKEAYADKYVEDTLNSVTLLWDEVDGVFNGKKRFFESVHELCYQATGSSNEVRIRELENSDSVDSQIFDGERPNEERIECTRPVMELARPILEQKEETIIEHLNKIMRTNSAEELELYAKSSKLASVIAQSNRVAFITHQDRFSELLTPSRSSQIFDRLLNDTMIAIAPLFGVQIASWASRAFGWLAGVSRIPGVSTRLAGGLSRFGGFTQTLSLAHQPYTQGLMMGSMVIIVGGVGKRSYELFNGTIPARRVGYELFESSVFNNPLMEINTLRSLDLAYKMGITFLAVDLAFFTYIFGSLWASKLFSRVTSAVSRPLVQARVNRLEGFVKRAGFEQPHMFDWSDEAIAAIQNSTVRNKLLEIKQGYMKTVYEARKAMAPQMERLGLQPHQMSQHEVRDAINRTLSRSARFKQEAIELVHIQRMIDSRMLFLRAFANRSFTARRLLQRIETIQIRKESLGAGSNIYREVGKLGSGL